MTKPIHQTVSKLLSLLEIRYIYNLEYGHEDSTRSLYIIILETSCSSLSKELSSMVGKIFQDGTNDLYRIFPFDYAEQQLRDQNLFFVHACALSNLIYSNPTKDIDMFDQYNVDEILLNNIRNNFSKELVKVNGFIEGADFFLEKGNLSQSAFMLHQFIELLFRNLGLFMMGRERKCHSIKEQQTYIKEYVPKLGSLFSTEKDEEQILLKLLDEAYITTRYSRNYHINKEQIQYIREKAEIMYELVGKLFEEKLNSSKNRLESENSLKIPHTSEASGLKESFTESNQNEILSGIKNLADVHFDTLKRFPSNKELYYIALKTDGYLETSFMIANLLKVCITALDSDYNESEYTIREVLGYILDLIPYEEMEFLDKTRDLLKDVNLKVQS